MTSQEQHVLDEFYKNAVMGADATSTILPKADHPDLRQELCKQLDFYQSRKEEIRSQMQPGSCAASPAKRHGKVLGKCQYSAALSGRGFCQ